MPRQPRRILNPQQRAECARQTLLGDWKPFGITPTGSDRISGSLIGNCCYFFNADKGKTLWRNMMSIYIGIVHHRKKA
jgi:hypothetical protein